MRFQGAAKLLTFMAALGGWVLAGACALDPLVAGGDTQAFIGDFARQILAAALL